MDLIKKLKSVGVSDEIINSDGIKAIAADVAEVYRKTEDYSTKLTSLQSDKSKIESENRTLIEARDKLKQQRRELKTALGLDEKSDVDVVDFAKKIKSEQQTLLASTKNEVISLAKKIAETDEGKKGLALLDFEIEKADEILATSENVNMFKNKLNDLNGFVAGKRGNVKDKNGFVVTVGGSETGKKEYPGLPGGFKRIL